MLEHDPNDKILPHKYLLLSFDIDTSNLCVNVRCYWFEFPKLINSLTVLFTFILLSITSFLPPYITLNNDSTDISETLLSISETEERILA